MIRQTYSHLWVEFNSAIKVTSFKICNCEEDTFNIEITFNRYTDNTCQYDICQDTKVFSWISWEELSLNTATIHSDLEDLLLPLFEWAIKV